MSDDHPPFGLRLCPDSGQLLHQKGAGQPVEPVAPHSHLVVTPRDGQQASDTRHGVVKRGIEAGDLFKFRIAPAERFDQGDFRRHMFRVIGTDSPQLGQHVGSDRRGPAVRHAAVHHAMADGADLREGRVLLQPIHQQAGAGPMIGSIVGPLLALSFFPVGHDHHALRDPDAIDHAAGKADERPCCSVQREFQAGGASVDRQDEGPWSHVVHAGITLLKYESRTE